MNLLGGCLWDAWSCAARPKRIQVLARPLVRTQPLDRPGPASRPRHPSRGDSRVNLTARLLSLWPTAPETPEDPQYSQQR